MYEQFITKKFKPETELIISQADDIMRDYAQRGFKLTLRQLFYQFVARDLLPNTQKNYKRLGRIVDDGRQAGLLDWSSIEDRQRKVERPSTWDSAEDILRAVARQYQEDPWKSQNSRVEVWIEKEALVGVIEPVCTRYRVPYLGCKGYASQTVVYDAGKRFEQMIREGLTPIVLHLGDHDPSGIHMTEDNWNRIELFASGQVEVRRLALNMDQIDQYNPPPNPAKEVDPRFEAYAEQFGDTSWELDALDPDVIDEIVEAALKDCLDDPDGFDQAMEDEKVNARALKECYQGWDAVKRYLKYRNTPLDLDDMNARYEPDEIDVDSILVDLEMYDED